MVCFLSWHRNHTQILNVSISLAAKHLSYLLMTRVACCMLLSTPAGGAAEVRCLLLAVLEYLELKKKGEGGCCPGHQHSWALFQSSSTLGWALVFWCQALPTLCAPSNPPLLSTVLAPTWETHAKRKISKKIKLNKKFIKRSSKRKRKTTMYVVMSTLVLNGDYCQFTTGLN